MNMKTGNRSNALLVELIIVVMFFMLAATVLMQVFAKARTMSDRARIVAAAVADAQSCADILSVTDDAEGALQGMGYVKDGADWVLQGPDTVSSVSIAEGADGLKKQTVTVRAADGSVLITLPCSKLTEVRP